MGDIRCGTCCNFLPARDKAGRAIASKEGRCLYAADFIEQTETERPDSIRVYAALVGAWHGEKCPCWQGGRDRNVGKTPKGGGA